MMLPPFQYLFSGVYGHLGGGITVEKQKMKESSGLIPVTHVIQVLTESVDPAAYWRKLKQRLLAEGNESVTNCHGLKLISKDGKRRLTDVASTEQLLRLIQSIPSKKAEPFKLWLAQVGRERIEETIDPMRTSPFTKLAFCGQWSICCKRIL